jgi:hypothetical protein
MTTPQVTRFDDAVRELQVSAAEIIQKGDLQEIATLCERVERLSPALGAIMDGVEVRLGIRRRRSTTQWASTQRPGQSLSAG